MGVITSRKFWQWGDDINTNDGITPFDGTVTVWEGEPNTAWSMGEIYGNWKKIPFFFPPLIFYKFFSRKKVGKKLDQGVKYYIVSPQAYIQEAV